MGKIGSRGIILTTVEYTCGLGEKQEGGSLKHGRTAAYVCTIIESRPQSLVPGGATIRSANSLWYISTASLKPISRRRKVIFEETEYGRFDITISKGGSSHRVASPRRRVSRPS